MTGDKGDERCGLPNVRRGLTLDMKHRHRLPIFYAVPRIGQVTGRRGGGGASCARAPGGGVLTI